MKWVKDHRTKWIFKLIFTIYREGKPVINVSVFYYTFQKLTCYQICK